MAGWTWPMSHSSETPELICKGFIVRVRPYFWGSKYPGGKLQDQTWVTHQSIWNPSTSSHQSGSAKGKFMGRSMGSQASDCLLPPWVCCPETSGSWGLYWLTGSAVGKSSKRNRGGKDKMQPTSTSVAVIAFNHNDLQRVMSVAPFLLFKSHINPSFGELYSEEGFGKCSSNLDHLTQYKSPQSMLCHPYINLWITFNFQIKTTVKSCVHPMPDTVILYTTIIH